MIAYVASYLTGGAGSKKPSLLVATQLDVSKTGYKIECVLAELQRMMDKKDTNGQRVLQRAIIAKAKSIPVMAAIAEECGELASSLTSGGVLETSQVRASVPTPMCGPCA